MALLFCFLVSMNGAFALGLLGHGPPVPSSTPFPSNTPNKAASSDAQLLHQILTQETTLRVELQRNVQDMMKEFEQMKKSQVAMEMKVNNLNQAKMEQDNLIQQLIDNVTILSMENAHLNQVLLNSSNGVSNTGSKNCMCHFTNVSNDIQNVKKEVRYVSLSFLDLQRDVQLMNSSILTSIKNSEGVMSHDVSNILSDIQNLSKIQDQDRQYQGSINTDLKIQQRNVSNTIKDHIDKEVLNLTAKYFELENQEQYLTSTLRKSELFLSKVAVFMNETENLQKMFLRMQHEQVHMSTDISDLMSNLTQQGLDVRNTVAFSATITSGIRSQDGQTLVFPHVLCNVGGGYNSHDGIFTAPVDGVYVFFVRITQDTNSHDMFINIVLNGSDKTKNLLFGRNDHAYRISANSIVLNLNRNDRVWVKTASGGSMFTSSITIGADQSFSGYKV